jgi:Complex 1 protein (LYR family)
MAVPSTNPLHLYRALLRECTYLPDSQARTYVRSHVIDSYRRYLPKNPKWRKEIPLPRQKALLKRGRKELSVLRRANEGYLKPLQNVLLMTYGRKGKRRRDLMDKLMQQETPKDHKAVEALSGKDKYTRDWQPPAMVMALLRSQAKNKDGLDRIMVGSTKLKPKPDIPEKNIWGRDMPEKREKNMMRKWYAKQMDRVLPPLPDPEFERLRALADGEAATDEGPRPRRKRVRGAETSNESILNERLILEGPQKGHTFHAYVQGRPHNLTSRLLQRVWTNIFCHVPKMTWDTTRQKWTVEWNVKLTARPLVQQTSDEKLEAMFGDLRT